MSEQSPQPQASAQRKAWYLKWWVWLVAAVVVAGGISALVNPTGDNTQAGIVEPTQSSSAEPSASTAPTQPAPLDLTAYLTNSGIAFDSARINGARKALIYVPTDTTNERAQQIANDAMLYMCDYARQAGDKFPAANRVEVSDSDNIYSPGYNAADHPSGFATDDVCQG